MMIGGECFGEFEDGDGEGRRMEGSCVVIR